MLMATTCAVAQAAALLATVEGLLCEVEAAAERRAEVLDRLEELELRREETAWLAAYEADDGRYKVSTHRQNFVILEAGVADNRHDPRRSSSGCQWCVVRHCVPKLLLHVWPRKRSCMAPFESALDPSFPSLR